MHADRLEPFLDELRKAPGVLERSRGVFYRGGRAFLHFHEDPTGPYADLRMGEEFERFPVDSDPERRRLLELVRSA